MFTASLIGGVHGGIEFEAGSHDYVIDGIDFEKTASGPAIAAFAVRTSTIRRPISRIEIRNCRFQRAVVGKLGRGHILAEGRGISYGWDIHDCVFEMGAYQCGVWMSTVSKSRFHRNWVSMKGTRCALFWNNQNDSRNVIANNVVEGVTSTDPDASALDLAGASMNNDVCFNTIRLTSDGAAIRTMGSKLHYNFVYSNIMQVTGKGCGLWVVGTPQRTFYWRSDHNLYHVASGLVGRIGTASYRGLPAWRSATAKTPLGQQDGKSQEGDPLFKSLSGHALSVSSPAIGRASVFGGRHSPGLDRDGWLRGSKQDVGAFELIGSRIYGAGCPGIWGIPVIRVAGNLAPGESVAVDVARGRRNSSGILSIGLGRTKLLLGGTCHLLHSPSIMLVPVAIDPNGNGTLVSRVPATSPVTGRHLYLQAGIADAVSAIGVSVSPGLEIRF